MSHFNVNINDTFDKIKKMYENEGKGGHLMHAGKLLENIDSDTFAKKFIVNDTPFVLFSSESGSKSSGSC